MQLYACRWVNTCLNCAVNWMHSIWLGLQCLHLLHFTIFTTVLCLLLTLCFANAVLTSELHTLINYGALDAYIFIIVFEGSMKFVKVWKINTNLAYPEWCQNAKEVQSMLCVYVYLLQEQLTITQKALLESYQLSLATQQQTRLQERISQAIMMENSQVCVILLLLMVGWALKKLK